MHTNEQEARPKRGSDVTKSNSPGFSGENAAMGSARTERERERREGRRTQRREQREKEGEAGPLDNFKYEGKVSQMSHKCHKTIKLLLRKFKLIPQINSHELWHLLGSFARMQFQTEYIV